MPGSPPSFLKCSNLSGLEMIFSKSRTHCQGNREKEKKNDLKHDRLFFTISLLPWMWEVELTSI
jgi:hypothetical protein